MKVGVHAGENLDHIIARKTQEIEEAGFAFWGYGGNTCYPTSMVQPFAQRSVENGKSVFLCMHEMTSHHFAEPIRAELFSTDGKTWKLVPSQINVLGSRFALTIQALRREEFVLPLSETRVAIGKSLGRAGNEYVKGQVDKACLELSNRVALPSSSQEGAVQINLVAELCAPYAVFLKN
jgi:hypothetical protein